MKPIFRMNQSSRKWSVSEFTATVGIKAKVGGVYDFGTDASPKLHFSVQSRSWDSTGVETVKTRTVYAKKLLRKPYPYQDTNEESKRLIFEVVLNDFIYDDDVILSGTMEAGFFTDSGTGGTGLANALTVNYKVANNSADAYVLPIPCWLSHDLDIATGSTHNVKLAVAHRHFEYAKMVQAVEFIATDETGNSVSSFTTDMTKVDYTASGLSAPCYETNIALTTLNAAELITVDVKIYPFIGDVYQASIDASPYPSPNFTVLKFMNDKDGTYGTVYAYVDGVGGTPAVSEDAVTARTTPYATVAEAGLAIKDYNNTNFGRNGADGGVIRLEEGTYSHTNFSTASTLGFPLILESADPTKVATTVYNNNGFTGLDARNWIPKQLIVKDLTVSVTQVDVLFWDNAAALFGGEMLVFKNVNFELNGGNIYQYFCYRVGLQTNYNCTGVAVGQALRAGNVSRMINSIGCQSGCIDTYETYNALCCRDTDVKTWEGGSQVSDAYKEHPTGVFLGWNFLTNMKTDKDICKPFSDHLMRGCAVVGNVLEQAGAGIGRPLMSYGDGNLDPVQNYLDIANTVIGFRSNQLYSDGGTDTIIKNGVSSIGVHWEWNCKADLYAPESGNRIGNWDFVNRVGSKYRALITEGADLKPQGTVGAWVGEVIALGDINNIDPSFTDDASAKGTGLGGGDYRPVVATTQLPQVPYQHLAFPFDLYGQVVPIDGTAYVGALQAV